MSLVFAEIPRLLPLLVCGFVACSRPAADCPPAATTQTATPERAGADPITAEPEPEPVPGAAEALTVTADDGHELRLWALLPPGEADPERRAVVFVHGRTWSSLPDFDLRVGDDPSLSIMYSLASRGVATYALDLRGYGQTPRDASAWLEPERAAADLHAALSFVAEREGEAPDVFGWSLGALVAALAVQEHPDAARSLVLYGFPRDLDALHGAASPGPDADPPKQANTKVAAASDFITEGTLSQAQIDAFVEAALAADPVRVDWRAMDQFGALDPEQLPVPTLVIHGVHDPIARQLWQAKLFTRMTVAERQWVIIPDADHAAHLEQPELFVRALSAFLGLDPPAAP